MMSRRVAVLVTTASRRSQLRYQSLQWQLHYYATSSLSSLSSQSSSSLSSCSGNKRLISSSSSSSSSSSTSTTTSTTVSSITGYLKDVVRTKSLQPINPIIESLPSHENVLKSLTYNGSSDSSSLLKLLPDFSYIEPHHINDKIIGSIRRQYNVDLAQLEVKLAASTTRSATAVSNYQSDEETNGAIDTNNASSSSSSISSNLLLLELDRLQAPIMQLEDISELHTSLASPPDQIEDWYNASDKVYEQTGNLLEKMYQSRIIYRALVDNKQQQQQNQSSSASASKSSSFLVPFLKRGCHIEIEDNDNNDSNNDNRNSQYIEIQNELMILNQRLLSIINYEKSSKAMRLQCMSDMYNCIGLTRLQSQTLLDNGNNEDNNEESNNSSVWNLAKLQHNHLIHDPQKELLDTIYPEITKFLLPHLPKQTKLNLDGVGAFLDSKNQDGSLHSNNKYTMSSMMTEIQRKELLKSKYDFKQRIRLHGAIAGIIDFCDTILGIHVVQEEQEQDDSKASNKGWNKNVRLLHLYKKQNEESDGDDDSTYLGTIYLDLFADSYWRTDEAKELVTSKLFNSSLITSQTIGPCVVMSLKIYPIWDNTPIPITFSDLSQLLYQFGKSIQLLLQQSNIKNKYYSPSSSMGLPEPSPIDTSEVMAHFMEMWILNDGFLNRLAQLSSSSSSSSTEDNDDNANVNDDDEQQQQQQQDEVMLFDDDTLQILRNDYKKEKALHITNTMFLSALQFEVFTIFNPRGDETLVGLQERIANLYLPKSCQPDTSDLSPLLAVFQQSNDSQYMSMHATLYSNIISANLYEKFQFLLYEVRQQEDACKLGIGIRALFLSSNNSNSNSLQKDIEELLLIGDNNKNSNNNNNNKRSTTTLKEKKVEGEDEEDNNNSSISSSIIDDDDTTTNIISCAPLKRVYQFDKI